MRGAKRKILFLTGTRADFGKLKPLILAAQEEPSLDSRVFVTGMHLLERYGSTIGEIHKAGIRDVYPFINQDASITSQMDIVLANTIQGLSHYVREFRPDLLVVHGDRVETLAGAIVGSLNLVLTAHVEGGEVSGTVDELLRHSISKLSHVHFVSNEEARRRLMQMGEIPESIFVIGSPEVDIMLSDDIPEFSQVQERYDIPFDRFVVLILHPDLAVGEDLPRFVSEVLEGVERSGANVVALYPNNDHGSEVILDQLLQREPSNRFHILPSMRFEFFLSLLRHADAIVGNSSAGVREAPVYGTPTVNVGERQANRFRYPSIIEAAPTADSVADAIQNLPKRGEPVLNFGSGSASASFIQTVNSSQLWKIQTQKQFRDFDVEVPLVQAEQP